MLLVHVQQLFSVGILLYHEEIFINTGRIVTNRVADIEAVIGRFAVPAVPGKDPVTEGFVPGQPGETVIKQASILMAGIFFIIFIIWHHHKGAG
jgi:hypothetical protein